MKVCSAQNKKGLPRLPTLVGRRCVKSPQVLDTTADTAAEVTIAGTMYLEVLGIKRKYLRPPSDTLKHAAGGSFPQ